MYFTVWFTVCKFSMYLGIRFYIIVSETYKLLLEIVLSYKTSVLYEMDVNETVTWLNCKALKQN